MRKRSKGRLDRIAVDKPAARTAASATKPLAFGGWSVVRVDGGRIHVVPRSDGTEHALTAGCMCRPRIDESDKRIIVHHAADGRERFERLRKM